jgi:L-ascorbate metabolism protein UlaG (beta-lactamase superfamily)
VTVRQDGLAIDWLGYATARIEWPDGTVAYTDPGRYGVLTGEWEEDGDDETAGHPPSADRRPQDGDVVVVTHDHHYDSDGIRRVAKPDAAVVVYEAVYPPGIGRDVDPLDDLPQEVVRVDYESDLLVDDVVVRAVEAYTGDGGDDSSHPEGLGCGFLLTHGDRTVFWPGDTDVIEGHGLLDVDVFVPPISGQITMDEREAADLAAELDPDLVVPVHYDTFERLAADEAAFAVAVASHGVPVALDGR